MDQGSYNMYHSSLY